MSSVVQAITVPRDSANDDHGIVVRWLQHSGDRVQAGEVVCELEFSKAVVEIETEVSGYICHRFAEGDEAPVGETLAVISDQQPESKPTRSELPQSDAVQPSNPTGDSATTEEKIAYNDFRITAKAQSIIDQHGLSPELFAQYAIVKERHVLRYLGQQGPPNPDSKSVSTEASPRPAPREISVSPIRRRAAAALSASWREIPHSHISRWLDASKVEGRAGRISKQFDMTVSISDLLVQAAAIAAAKDERVLRHWSGGRVVQAEQVNIGFALNQRNGDLIVPVVRCADTLDMESLVGRIRGLQKAAIRKSLEPDDLSGGTLTVTSLVGSHVHSVSPIIAPKQSVIVALGDRVAGPESPTYSLTMAFDHRVLNGSEAAEFLFAVSRQLEESP